MNIFEALRKDHDIQRDLVDKLVETHGDTELRDTLFARLRCELKSHAVAEERHFYIPLMEVDLTQEKSRHSIAEHHEMDEMMETLQRTDYSSPAWLAEAKNLHHRVLHHLREEEQEVFQLAGKALEDAQKKNLAKDYDAEMKLQRAKDW